MCGSDSLTSFAGRGECIDRGLWTQVEGLERSETLLPKEG